MIIYKEGDKVRVVDVIILNTCLPFTITMIDPYHDGSDFYEVTNGYEIANIHISRLSPFE